MYDLELGYKPFITILDLFTATVSLGSWCICKYNQGPKVMVNGIKQYCYAVLIGDYYNIRFKFNEINKWIVTYINQFAMTKIWQL